MNAAGALIVADAAGTWDGGAERAAEAIDSGRAAARLDRWIAFRWATPSPRSLPTSEITSPSARRRSRLQRVGRRRERRRRRADSRQRLIVPMPKDAMG